MELSETRDNKVRKYSNLRFEGYASFSSSSSSFYVRDAKSSPLRAKKFPLRYSLVCRCKLLANYFRLTDEQKVAKITPAGRVNRSSW